MRYFFSVLLAAACVSPAFAAGFPFGVKTDTLRFICNELLSRPAATSISVHACANHAVDVYFEYGTDSINYSSQTSVISRADSVPFAVTISNLNPNTQYFYRMRYRQAGGTVYLARASHTFRTQRPPGASFAFAVEADPHLDTNSNPPVYALTLQNILAQRPDFLLDLGDTFMSEKLPAANPVTIRDRNLLLRSFFDIACHSVPLFLVQGNHDGELGWLLDSTANNIPVWAANTRKLYYPNPAPDAFYSGNSHSEPYVGLRENYYAWQWGDALFVVIDPYWYTRSKPAWGWTLGADQYNWLKTVLTASSAKYKFIFSHQLVGGNGTDGRGGIEFAHLYEMGGRNTDSTWGFDTYRPGWGKPIHQLMVENHVNIFFHGHDHFYGKQEKDGVEYQEVPQPSLRSYTSIQASQYGYVNGVFIPSRGYLRVTISPAGLRVDYVRTYLPSEETGGRHNGDVAFSYSIDTTGVISQVKDAPPALSVCTLYQNYPNPFNPETKIAYDVVRAAHVSLKVFDVLGREVRTLVDEEQPAGTYTLSFNPVQYSLASGIYFCRMQAGEYSKSVKMVCLK